MDEDQERDWSGISGQLVSLLVASEENPNTGISCSRRLVRFD